MRIEGLRRASGFTGFRAEKVNEKLGVKGVRSMGFRAEKTSLRAEKRSNGGVSGPAGLRAEKDIEKPRGTVQGGWSHGSPSRDREV